MAVFRTREQEEPPLIKIMFKSWLLQVTLRTPLKFIIMRTNLILLLLLGSFEVLHAQRTVEPDKPIIAGTVPVSNRFNYSTAGRDSLRVELINVDVPGLEIISCEDCIVSAPWFLSNGGKLDVIVKNRGAIKSQTATVWVEYGVYQMTYPNAFKKVLFSGRRGVPVLEPGQTTKLTFNINSSFGDMKMKVQTKLVRVSLTQNGGRAWREN